MKAEDTVLRDKEWMEMEVPSVLFGSRSGKVNILSELEAQADISFKLGKTAGVAESLIPALKAIDGSRKAGRKEVAEYLGVYENELGFCEISNHAPYAKLKKWGIECKPES